MQFRIASVFGLAVVLLAGLHQAAGQRDAELEKQLQAAIHREMVDGDLKAAIEMYRKIVARPGGNRTAAATALLHIGQCQEKLGNAEARKAYEQLLREYSDQGELAAQARTRLAALGKAGGLSYPPQITLHKIWAGDAEGGSIDPQAAVSSDGRYLSFVDWNADGNLAVHDLSTGQDRRITNNADGKTEFAEISVVSPDSKQIAYYWHHRDESTDLRVIGLDGSNLRVVFRAKDGRYIQPSDWSADGKQILAVFSRKDKPNQVVLVSAADGSVRVLLESPEWRWPAKPRLSPDGRWVLYDVVAREGSRQHDIFLLSVEGGRETPLVQHAADDLGPVWTPDGKKVLFASDRMGSMGFWAIAVVDGKPHGAPELVKRDIGQLSQATGFTRQGSYYYAVGTAMEDVYVAEIDPVTGKLATPPVRTPERFVGSNFGPAWSRDGRYLAYHSRRGREFYGPGALTLVIRSLQTGEERDLSDKLHQGGPVRWFPDGRSLLVPVWENSERSRLAFYRLDVQTGEASPIKGGLRREASLWALSSDGKVIFYRQVDDAKNSRVLVHHLETGEQKEIYRLASPQELGKFDVSPDGRNLAFTVRDTTKSFMAVKVMPVSGGEPRELVRAQRPENIVYSSFTYGLAWTPDSRHLLVVRSAKGRITELWRVPAAGGEPQKVGLVMERIGFPTIHPDGRRIAFDSGIRGNHEIWVMENFLPELSAAR